MRLLSKEEIDGLIDERDMLADENKSFAEFLYSLGYNSDDIDRIATGDLNVTLEGDE